MKHLRDTRRPRGRYYRYGSYGQVEQFPVICALDILEIPLTQGTKLQDYITEDPSCATCRECRGRIFSQPIAV